MAIALKHTNLDAIVDAYQRDGIVVLSDVDPGPLDTLTQMLSDCSGLTAERIEAAGRGHDDIEVTAEMRQNLARGLMTPELMATCHETFGDVLVRLIGPIVHTSQTFHYQIKKRSESDVVRHGHSGDGREVRALYGIHNELTAARVLTTPSALVCWVPLNDYEGDALYFYPGSHRRGLLVNGWLPRHEDLEGSDRVGPVMKYRPKRGQIVLFHFLLMHGSGAPSATDRYEDGYDPVRISCDLRFFPFCGVLDSSATSLRPDPIGWIHNRMGELSDDLLLAPLYETLAYCGLPIEWPHLPAYSPAFWAQFIEGLLVHDESRMDAAVENLVNTEAGFDPVTSYQERFRAARLCRQPYESIRESVPEAEPVLSSLAR